MSLSASVKYRQLPKGKYTLVFLGNLFFNSSQGWYIAVWLKSENGQLSSHSFRVEALPDLRLGQQFVDGVAIPAAADRTFSLPLPSVSLWQNKSAGVAIPRKLWPLYGEVELCHQNVFVISQNNRKYVLPVIELARALLIPKKVVAKHLLTPSGLSGIALVHENQPCQGEAQLKFRSDTPLYLIEDPACRNHLVWMLRHEEPGRLFSSVYQHMLAQQSKRAGGGYKRFIFNMDAPGLSNVRLYYSGPIQGDTVFVREIVGFSNLSVAGYKNWISHPSKKEPVSNEATQSSNSTIALPIPENIDIDEQEEDTNTSGHNRFVDVRPVSLEFAVEPVTEVIYNSSKASQNGSRKDYSSYETEGTQVGGLGDPSKDGQLKPLEYGYIRCSSQDRTGGLKLFAQVAKNLAKSNNWGLSILYFELPNVTRSNFRQIEGRPRQAGLATFLRQDGTTRHLLEVQISDGRYLSTLLLTPEKVVAKEVCQQKAELLLRAVVKGGGHWKEEVLKPLRQVLRPFSVQKIRHPGKLYDKSMGEACTVWAEKLQRNIE